MHHVYMGNFYFQGLTDGQIGILKNHGYWKHIVANRKKNMQSVKYTSIMSNQYNTNIKYKYPLHM